MTCRERYEAHVVKIKANQGCSVDDEDGEPLVPYQPCEQIDDCSDLWEAVCEECPLLSAVGTGPCKNDDGTGYKE